MFLSHVYRWRKQKKVINSWRERDRDSGIFVDKCLFCKIRLYMLQKLRNEQTDEELSNRMVIGNTS